MQSRESTGACSLDTEFGVSTTGKATMLLTLIRLSQGRLCPRLLNTAANLKAGCAPHEEVLDLRVYQRTCTLPFSTSSCAASNVRTARPRGNSPSRSS
eukprot:1284951-Pleurochrysis_carterae.AAC.1